METFHHDTSVCSEGDMLEIKYNYLQIENRI